MRSTFRTLTCALALFAFAPASGAHAAAYDLDPAHTMVYFKVNHLGMSNVFGRFDTVSGSVDVDPTQLAGAKIAIEVDTASVSTNAADRDKHLRSPDFFNASEFPEMKFESTALELADGKRGKLTGNLTLLGVTKPVTLDVTVNFVGPHPNPRLGGKPTLGVSASGSLKRSDFGMKGFLPGVGDDITLMLEIEALER